MDAETRRQPDRGQDPGYVGQAADERLLLGTQEALVIAVGHVVLLRSEAVGCTRSMMRNP